MCVCACVRAPYSFLEASSPKVKSAALRGCLSPPRPRRREPEWAGSGVPARGPTWHVRPQPCAFPEIQPQVSFRGKLTLPHRISPPARVHISRSEVQRHRQPLPTSHPLPHISRPPRGATQACHPKLAPQELPSMLPVAFRSPAGEGGPLKQEHFSAHVRSRGVGVGEPDGFLCDQTPSALLCSLRRRCSGEKWQRCGRRQQQLAGKLGLPHRVGGGVQSGGSLRQLPLSWEEAPEDPNQAVRSRVPVQAVLRGREHVPTHSRRPAQRLATQIRLSPQRSEKKKCLWSEREVAECRRTSLSSSRNETRAEIFPSCGLSCHLSLQS